MSDDLTLRDVLAVIERLYPPDTAQSWDRVGLVTGDLDQPVRRLHLALDPTLAVIGEARSLGVDLLLTHHPLLLRGVHSVATTTAKGASVTELIVGDIALYVAHTNADCAADGVSQALAQACGLSQISPLTIEEGQNMGRVGVLESSLSLRSFVEGLARALPVGAGGIRVSGPPEAPVRRVAVLGGSGDGLFESVRAAGVDAYVTSDLRHHPAIEAREESRDGPPYLVDAGHFASEWVWLPTAKGALDAAFDGRVEITISTISTDPWTFTVGAR